MTNAAAISGTFSDFRTVKGRKVCQLVIEVPIEIATAALTALGGVPNPADPQWVAIALLQSKPKAEPTRRPWSEMSASQQAAIRGAEWDFRRFLKALNPAQPAHNADAAAEWIRRWCKVQSRRDLNVNPDVQDDWRKLDDMFRAWLPENPL